MVVDELVEVVLVLVPPASVVVVDVASAGTGPRLAMVAQFDGSGSSEALQPTIMATNRPAAIQRRMLFSS